MQQPALTYAASKKVLWVRGATLCLPSPLPPPPTMLGPGRQGIKLHLGAELIQQRDNACLQPFSPNPIPSPHSLGLSAGREDGCRGEGDAGCGSPSLSWRGRGPVVEGRVQAGGLQFSSLSRALIACRD